jgi:hypothetical protein
MKLVMILYAGPTPLRVESLLDRHRAVGYSEFRNVRGSGLSGRRAGTRAWPGESSLFLTVTPPDQVDQLVAALRSEAGTLPAGERLHVAVLPTESFF